MISNEAAYINQRVAQLREEFELAGAGGYYQFSWTKVLVCSIVPAMTVVGTVVAVVQWM